MMFVLIVLFTPTPTSVLCNIPLLSSVFSSQITLNEQNKSNKWCNCFNLHGMLCIDSNVLSVCAEQMPMFPAAPLIMTGIIVIELLSHCFAHAELHRPTAVRLRQSALGRGLTADRKDREMAESRQRAPIKLFRNIYDPCCFLKSAHKIIINTCHCFHCIFFPSYHHLTWLLLPGEAWTKVSSTTFMLLLPLVP